MDSQFFLYKFTTPSRDFRFTNVAHVLEYEEEEYDPIPISHSPPTFSSDFSEARITVSLKQDQSVALDYISRPPPYETRLRIWEVLRASQIVGTNTYLVDAAEPYWKGKIIRPSWRDSFRRVEITCKTLADVYFDKESNNESLHPLCRFFPGGADGRCPVNWENYKETVTVTDIGTETVEPQITVSGIGQLTGWYTAGIIRTADGDMRTINLHESGGVLTLSAHFPASTLQVGDTVDLIAGDDLTFETCTVKFGAETSNGRDWGGWKWTPNRDPQKSGVLG
jgi:hypothetical protein